MRQKAGIQKVYGTIGIIFLAVLCIMMCGMHKRVVMAAGIELEADSVKVGKQISFWGNVDGYSFKSSDSQIAYISGDGIITGKKQGNVTITAAKSGNKKKFPLTVKKNGNKPAIKVCPDEISVGIPEVVLQNGENSIAFTVQNNSASGVIKKVKCTFLCSVVCKSSNLDAAPGENVGDDTDSGKNGSVDESADSDAQPDVVTMEKVVSVNFGKIQPGKEAVFFYNKLDNLLELQEAEMQSFTVYSGEAKVKYDVMTDTVSYNWGTKDTTAPVIQGFVGSNGFNGKDIYIVLYEDKKTAYRKFVTAYDDRDGQVTVKADFSMIDWSKKGTYTVTVTAKDKAGNQSKKKMKVQVRCLTGVDLYADQVLRRITKSGWSDKAKCKAIYSYVQSHMSYVNYNGGNSWESAALRGLRYGNGNCYAYYGLARLLLTRAGIPNVMITRYPAVPNHHHWWNLAYVNGGWYHFDTTPRRLRGRFCLLTDAQLRIYERRSPGTFRYAGNLYPKRAVKVICSGPF